MSKYQVPTSTICGVFLTPFGGGGGSATRPLPRDGDVEKLHGDPTVGPRPKV